jgi:hypothetical protein
MAYTHVMATLMDKIFAEVPADPSAKRIERQLKHVERAMANETDERRKDYLEAVLNTLLWARAPDAYNPPVLAVEMV